ncbi:hypothetical protein [Paenibacillus sp. GXUN7292]|uniref:hypothetical protein n=1 Tax=Paenibacillus sp. GXUN7292 TaxID=3422499 RepID=UPI003D7EBF34
MNKNMKAGSSRQLFYLQTTAETLDEFIKENYISIDVPWLQEDVELISWEQLCSMFAEASVSEELRLFVYEMNDEDLILASDGKRVYSGDMGDYYFVAGENQAELQSVQLPPRLHRRGVTWLQGIDKSKAQQKLLKMMPESETLVRLAQSVTIEEVESLIIEKPQADHLMETADNSFISCAVDAATVREAIEVLKQALKSEDAERRERAAIALLQFAKQ